MSKKNLSQKLSEVLKEKIEIPQEEMEENKNPLGKNYLHETVDVIKKNRIFNESLNDDLDLSEESFRNINNSVLKEYVEKCGYPYTTRKQSIQSLFESNKVSQDVIYFLEDTQRQETTEDELKMTFNEFDESIEDEFTGEYGEDVDFRNIEGVEKFCAGSPEYDKLDAIPSDKWETYISILLDSKVQCIYDTEEDCYTISKFDTDEDVERYALDKEDIDIIEGIIKKSKLNLIEVRGMPKATGKEFVLEAVVEKEGYKTIVEYHDTALRKPWKAQGASFQFLQEALSSINIPYRELYKDAFVPKKDTMLESVAKQFSNKTTNLPLAEAERREIESKKLILKLEGKLHNSDAIIEQLNEGVKVITEKGNGTVRHIDWLEGTIHINTRKDSNGNHGFVSDISFDDIKEIKE